MQAMRKSWWPGQEGGLSIGQLIEWGNNFQLNFLNSCTHYMWVTHTHMSFVVLHVGTFLTIYLTQKKSGSVVSANLVARTLSPLILLPREEKSNLKLMRHEEIRTFPGVMSSCDITWHKIRSLFDASFCYTLLVYSCYAVD